MARRTTAFLTLAAMAAFACSDDPASPPDELTIVSLSPTGEATNVDPGVVVEIEFSSPMAETMSDLVALHEDTPAGALAAGTWEWSPDHLFLRFRVNNRLREQTRYHLHLGGGLEDAQGHRLNFEHAMQFHHGDWCTDGMAGGHHQFMHQHEWQHRNGSFGMVISFTTGQ